MSWASYAHLLQHGHEHLRKHTVADAYFNLPNIIVVGDATLPSVGQPGGGAGYMKVCYAAKVVDTNRGP